jgi:predicted transcriptional regulator
MKSVLISIKPKWCELIASGEKTIEVRKTKPKIRVPFKVYIYCTKDNTFAEKTLRGFDDNGKAIYYKANKGKVIGEFVCNKMLDSFLNNNDAWFVEKGCLTQKEIDEYQGDKAILYGWHISDLVIYDTPKDLSEYGLTRPPQSWCYVKDHPTEKGGAEE